MGNCSKTVQKHHFPDFARALDFSGSKGFGASKPSKKPLRSIKSCCNGVASDWFATRGFPEKRWVLRTPLRFLVLQLWWLLNLEPWTSMNQLSSWRPEHWIFHMAMAGKFWKNPLLAPTRLLEFNGGPLKKVRGYTRNLSGAPLQGYSRALDKLDAPKPLVSPFTVARILRSI